MFPYKPSIFGVAVELSFNFKEVVDAVDGIVVNQKETEVLVVGTDSS